MIDNSRIFKWFPTANLCKREVATIGNLPIYEYKQLWQQFETVKIPAMTSSGPALADVDTPTGETEWREISNFPIAPATNK